MKLHFTIRDLLWLTVVAALAVAWGLDHFLHSPGFRERQLELQLNALGKAAKQLEQLVLEQHKRIQVLSKSDQND
jgi:hypothetical protein